MVLRVSFDPLSASEMALQLLGMVLALEGRARIRAVRPEDLSPKGPPMTQMLDCLVSYFGLDENDRPGCRRYFFYHILAGPGPTAGTGVAAIRTLAVHNEAERCDSCQHFHVVESGGPEAAIATAIRYLDAYHENDHLRKVQCDTRDVPGDQVTDAVRPPETRFHVSRDWDVPTRKG
jgi:hypothetical protein